MADEALALRADVGELPVNEGRGGENYGRDVGIGVAERDGEGVRSCRVGRWMSVVGPLPVVGEKWVRGAGLDGHVEVHEAEEFCSGGCGGEFMACRLDYVSLVRGLVIWRRGYVAEDGELWLARRPRD